MFTVAVVFMRYVKVNNRIGGGEDELRAPPRVIALALQRRDVVTATTPS